jgi:aqualysin 1
MASPHVAGVVALYLAREPNSTPTEVATAIVNGSLSGKLTNLGQGSPNRLANISFLANPNDGGEDADWTKLNGSLVGRGDYDDYPQGRTYYATRGLQQLWLMGPEETDFDLYLYKWNGRAWVQVARSAGYTSEEKIVYSGQAGSYRIRVHSYAGAGAYQLWHKLP